VRGDQLALTPRVPASWPGFEITLRLAGKRFTLRHGEAGTEPPTLHAGIGEWVIWRQWPDGAVVQIGSAG
jgi:cyclic beta-1,2-glucan synthetase